MHIHIQWPFWVATLGSLTFLLAYVLWALARGAEAALSVPAANRLKWFAGTLMTAWLALTLLVASHGAFPFIALGVLAPTVAGALFLLASPALRAAVNAIPQYRLIGIQGLRMLGVSFLVLMAQHQLPAEFALPAGIGDILVGATALVLAREFYKGNRPMTTAAVLWNAAGILDLVSAITVGFLASTTPFRLIFSTPPTDAMSVLPMVMIPVFGIPIFLVLHGASLAKLRRRAVRADNRTSWTPSQSTRPLSTS